MYKIIKCDMRINTYLNIMLTIRKNIRHQLRFALKILCQDEASIIFHIKMYLYLIQKKILIVYANYRVHSVTSGFLSPFY